MTALLCNKDMKQFFDIIHKPICPGEDLLAHVRLAINSIENILGISKVLIDFTTSETRFPAQMQDFSAVLYQKEGTVTGHSISYNYCTGDGGQVVLTVFAMYGHEWDAEELDGLKIISNVIFNVFKVDNMNRLLNKAMSTDFSVNIPNMTGFMRFATEIFSGGLIDKYTGVYFNIHNFKYVNNVLSHIKADEVMVMYVETIKKQIRPDEIMARLGGDNYVALIHTENVERFYGVIKDVNIVYRSDNGEKQFRFGATIGASRLNDISHVGEVMMRTSIAYQVARQQESAEVIYYRDEYYQDVVKEKGIIAGFQRGLEQQEFVVYYQPKVICKDKSIYGGEALVRWNILGELIYPMEFIPVLEKDGSICKLDFYVLDKSCELLKRFLDSGMPLPRISVNFSRKHIGNPGLVQEIVAVIDKYGIPHEYVEIELTESEDFRDYIVMAKLIDELKSKGISTSIDDFGTGYSSLNMLKMTSIDILKIDKAFIPLEEEPLQKGKDCIMFESIARLAKELGVMIVAEGVETEQQYKYLSQLGCDIIQGYYFDKPLTEDMFMEKVKERKY